MINDFRSTIAKSVTADIMAIVLTIELNKELGFKLAQAGILYRIEPLDNCFEIQVSGHFSNILIGIEKIMEFLYNSSPSAESIDTAILNIKEQYQSMVLQPVSQSRQLRLTFLQHHQYLYMQKLEFLQSIQQAELNLSHVKILVFVAGNIETLKAVDLSEFIEGLLFAAEGKKLKYLTPRTVSLIPEEIIEWAQNSNDENNQESIIEIYFQFGTASLEERTMTLLLELILNEKIQAEFVENRKTCKTIAVSSRMTRGVSGVLIKASSVDHDPNTIEKEIFEYLKNEKKNFSNFFENKKNELISIKLLDFKDFQEKTDFFWDEILQGNLEFERQNKEVLFLKGLNFQVFDE